MARKKIAAMQIRDDDEDKDEDGDEDEDDDDGRTIQTTL